MVVVPRSGDRGAAGGRRSAALRQRSRGEGENSDGLLGGQDLPGSRISLQRGGRFAADQHGPLPSTSIAARPGHGTIKRVHAR